MNVQIPVDAIGAEMRTKTGNPIQGNAIIQHIAKVRTNRLKIGLPVPGILGNGVVSGSSVGSAGPSRSRNARSTGGSSKAVNISSQDEGGDFDVDKATDPDESFGEAHFNRDKRLPRSIRRRIKQEETDDDDDDEITNVGVKGKAIAVGNKRKRVKKADSLELSDVTPGERSRRRSSVDYARLNGADSDSENDYDPTEAYVAAGASFLKLAKAQHNDVDDGGSEDEGSDDEDVEEDEDVEDGGISAADSKQQNELPSKIITLRLGKSERFLVALKKLACSSSFAESKDASGATGKKDKAKAKNTHGGSVGPAANDQSIGANEVGFNKLSGAIGNKDKAKAKDTPKGSSSGLLANGQSIIRNGGFDVNVHQILSDPQAGFMNPFQYTPAPYMAPNNQLGGNGFVGGSYYQQAGNTSAYLDTDDAFDTFGNGGSAGSFPPHLASLARQRYNPLDLYLMAGSHAQSPNINSMGGANTTSAQATLNEIEEFDVDEFDEFLDFQDGPTGTVNLGNLPGSHNQLNLRNLNNVATSSSGIVNSDAGPTMNQQPTPVASPMTAAFSDTHMPALLSDSFGHGTVLSVPISHMEFEEQMNQLKDWSTPPQWQTDGDSDGMFERRN